MARPRKQTGGGAAPGFRTAAEVAREREDPAAARPAAAATAPTAPTEATPAAGDESHRAPFPDALAASVVAAVRSTGITSLYPPQREALQAFLDGRNVLVSIPTASGKSLIAHQAILHTLSERGGKAVYIVPLRALASEKYDELKELAAAMPEPRPRVAIATGDLDEADTQLARFDIIVTTSEKADSLIRHGARWFQELSIVVADEVHLLGDSGRGPTLEVTLARLLGLAPHVRLVALSATVGNAHEIAAWLDAALVVSAWRPVPLKEGVFFGDTVHFADGTTHNLKAGADAVVRLVADVIDVGGQALVFVGTRRSTESTATRLAEQLAARLPADDRDRLAAAADELNAQEGEASRLGQRLAGAVRGGAGFHHAGLSGVQRRRVESLFKAGTLRAIVATPTLAAGVNLPARRVVVRDLKRYSPEMGSMPLPVLEVKQMTGRAGRPRYDPYGEAVLVARSEAERGDLLADYLFGEPEPIRSALAQESALRIHLLAGIASGLTPSRRAVADFLAATFLARDPFLGGESVLAARVEAVLDFLAVEGFITASGEKLAATGFGKRVSDLYVDPMSAIMIRDGLAMTRLVPMVDDLALLALVASTPDVPAMWLRRGDDWVEAIADEYEGRWLRPAADDSADRERFLADLKTALMLKDWVEETRLERIEERFAVGPGDIQNRVQIASWLIYAAEEIARLDGSEALAQLGRLRRRVQAGVKAELLPLLALPGVGRYRARVLAQAGLGSMRAVAAAPVRRLLALPGFGPRIVAGMLKEVGREETLAQVEGVARGLGAARSRPEVKEEAAARGAPRTATDEGAAVPPAGPAKASAATRRGKPRPAATRSERERPADQTSLSSFEGNEEPKQKRKAKGTEKGKGKRKEKGRRKERGSRRNRRGARMGEAPPRWGPGALEPGVAVITLDPERRVPADLLQLLARLSARLGVPVQAVRGDRVLSMAHLAMAVEHARRARAAGRARADDPGLEFLLYLAGERQIGAVLGALGVPLHAEAGGPQPAAGAPLVVLVALGACPSERLAAAAREVGLDVVPGDPAACFGSAAAARWWDARLGGAAMMPAADREARVFALMARLAVTRA